MSSDKEFDFTAHLYTVLRQKQYPHLYVKHSTTTVMLTDLKIPTYYFLQSETGPYYVETTHNTK